MRFRDGQWLVAEGVQVQYAEEVYRITPTASGKGISLLCPTRKILNRGNTLNLATLSIDIEPAFDGVLSVETTHWQGAVRRGPDFDLFPAGRPEVDAKVTKTESGTTLSSGTLSATVSGKPHEFEIAFHPTGGKKPLTTLLNRSVGLAYTPAPSTPMQLADMRNFRHYIFTQTTLAVGESIHGLGERFGPFNKVGQRVELWNADGGTSSDQAYKNVGFWMSSRGYGVFVDTPGRVELEIGSERCCRLQTSVEGQRLRWFIIYGPSPRDILRRYSVLTGAPGSVPSWSFGLWLSTSFTTSYDEETVNSFLAGMRARDIPVEVFHFDCFWLKAFQWCDFEFDRDMFPDPRGQIGRLKAGGLVKKVCVWTNPYLGQASPVFAEAAARGYLLRRRNGDVFQWDLWQTGMGIVDFTNPDARAWFAACLDRLFDTGVDCIKTDFGERIPSEDVQWFDPSVDPERMHNYYAFIYNKLVYEALQRRYGANEAVLFARAATAGCQRFPLTWGGDCESTPEAMAESLRGGLSLGLSGFAFWSVDIGGFEGSPPPWIYKRWVAFGLLCSHSRLHGSNSYRVPWTVDGDDQSEEGCSATLRKWTHLKARLMPYLFSQAQESVRGGLPLSLRAMCIEFPDDPTAWTLDRQFMLGDGLLVAPVFEEDGTVEFYLPRGKWTNFFTGEVKEGPGWFAETHGFGTLPLYVRPNTLLVLGKEGETRTVYDYTSDVEVRAYFASDSASAVLVDAEGKTVGTLRVKDGEIIGKELLSGSSVINVVSS
ncbi:glycoside hydrolase family 31 protein [Thermothelomyces thermophilus ATCC 42464]|uniref:alpha-D-xyloside xylohydrolase n=1 Tax=Thermothelomyces thermophilus (strain ATCC 42464 / BCRC 31852 / DSM 1799) TaxID=573729 RepID=G2QMT8_THET4|nr:glycoside hydrolase family 31 protein [Thermothelomyces thermophilus ATCC 42464]AEO60478.1 glycoside hydrolase family 31 protein [Thermothelomyces thermophilus ATCC 42464]